MSTKLLNNKIDKQNDPKVSIVMPNYNSELFIEESILSIIDQSYTNWELIIIDDKSTDNSIKIIQKICDKNPNKEIYVYINEKREGAAICRNRAIKIATGVYVSFLDSDDTWHPSKLEKQIAFMVNNNYYFSYTNYLLMDEESKSQRKIVTGPRKVTKFSLHLSNWLGCLTVIYNKEKIGIVQITPIDKRNDYAMWLQVIKHSDCYLLCETLGSYRIRKGSISSGRKTKLIKYHYILFKKNQGMNRFMASLLVLVNMIFQVFKKVFYVKNIKKIR